MGQQWDPAILVLGAELGGARVEVGFAGIAASSRLAGGARHPAHPRVWDRVHCGWRGHGHGRVRRVQLGGVVVAAATFARVSATGAVFLMVYEVVGMRREGDEIEDLPNAVFHSPLSQPFFVSVARVSHWPLLAS